MMTQGWTLKVFYDIAQSLETSYSMNNIGFYVTDSPYFDVFKKENPDIENDKYTLLKEWEIVKDSHGIRPDLSILKELEKKFGEPYLWNALVADRRIYFGKKFAMKQDYHPRYSHQQMLSILQVAIQRVEELIEKVNPDCIFSFHCVTIGDYLSYLVSKKNGIQFLNLRPSRVLNYIYAGDSIHEPPTFLKDDYEKYYLNGVDPELRELAVEYLKSVTSVHSMYEGVVPASEKPPKPVKQKINRFKYFNIWKILLLVQNELKYYFGIYKYDNSIPGFIEPLIYKSFGKPIKARITKLRLAKHYLNKNDLNSIDYSFFPLHVEPELTLSVSSKPYLNQIEAIRVISHNLPVGMKLIVKEHPVSIGKRPLSYYHKILEIPNVLLANPSLTSREIILNSKLTFVIAGSVGLESAMLKKPVILFGGAPFVVLPSNMIRRVTDLNHLGQEIKDLLNKYNYDNEAMLSYIAAIMQNSVRVDFYSRLIGRKEAYREVATEGNLSDEEIRTNQITSLTNYLVSRMSLKNNRK